MVFAVPHDTVLITDGGLATELEARGHDLSDDLWSARLLVDAPDEIVAVHSAFFRAGASIATTASYQASFDGFAERGIGRDDAALLLRRSVELAKAARDEAGGQRWVAASVGPYGAALANGEEYVGRYDLSVAQLADWHRPRQDPHGRGGQGLRHHRHGAGVPQALGSDRLTLLVDSSVLAAAWHRGVLNSSTNDDSRGKSVTRTRVRSRRCRPDVPGSTRRRCARPRRPIAARGRPTSLTFRPIFGDRHPSAHRCWGRR